MNVKHEPESFIIGNGSEAREVMLKLGDWLLSLGFEGDKMDLGHRLYTASKFFFGEGQYRINKGKLERFDSTWEVVATSAEVERLLCGEGAV
jgi:hypothetical protein